jgi:hypothetical protein
VANQAFKAWTPDTFERTGETPQDIFREVELDALAEKYSRDWLVRLFSPLGIKEILEVDIEVLMRYMYQTYDAVMSMPCSRRRRMVETVRSWKKS